MNEENELIEVYCPDCRGRFEIPSEDFVEGDVIECLLCAADLFVLQEDPARVRIFSGDDDF